MASVAKALTLSLCIRSDLGKLLSPLVKKQHGLCDLPDPTCGRPSDCSGIPTCLSNLRESHSWVTAMDFTPFRHYISSLLGCRQPFDTKALRKIRKHRHLFCLSNSCFSANWILESLLRGFQLLRVVTSWKPLWLACQPMSFSRAPSKTEWWKPVLRDSLIPSPKASWNAPFSLRKGFGRRWLHAVGLRYPYKALQGQHGLGVHLQTCRRWQTIVIVSSFTES